MEFEIRKLGEFITQRKGYITISDSIEYKRCRVQVNRKGVVLRDIVKGLEINTKKQQVCKSGDFLVAEIDAKVGGYGFIPEELDNAIVSSHYYLFEVNERLFLSDFLKMLIKTEVLQGQINAKGSTNYSAIRPQDILNIEVPYTNITNQKKITKNFSSLENESSLLVTELQWQTDLIKKLRQSILQDAIQGKIVKQNSKDEPAGSLLEKIKTEKQKLILERKLKKEKQFPQINPDEIPFELPNGWAWCRLEDISNNIHYGFNASANYNIKDVRLVRITDIQDNKVDWDNVPGCSIKLKEYNSYSLNENDILIARTGGTIGKSFIVKTLNFKAVFASYLIRVIPSKIINSNYLKLFIESPLYWKQLIALSSGTGQPNVNGTSLKSLKTPLPPLSEQTRIVAKVEELMQICDALEKEVENSKTQLQKLMQSVLREAFEGKEMVFDNAADKQKKFTGTEKAILAGHIINLTNTEDFGRVKFQKLLYLTEHLCKLNLGSNYIQNVAGPYDGKLITEVESTLKRLGFYDIERSKTGRQINYTALGSASQLETYFSDSFGKDSTAIDELLKKFKKSTWEQTEIVATLYAAWNNRILKKEPVTDELLKQDFLAWDSQKKKYKDRLDAALVWMKKQQVVPDGWGKIIDKVKK